MAGKNQDRQGNLATDEDLRPIASLVGTGCVNQAIDERGELVRDWADSKKLWERRSITDVFDAVDVKHVPEPYNRSEGIVPRMYAGIYGVNPWFSVKATRKYATKYEPKIKELLDWQARQSDWRFYCDQIDGIRLEVIYGHVLYKTDWHKETRKVFERKVEPKEYRDPYTSELIAEEEKVGELEEVEQTIQFPRARPIAAGNEYIDRYSPHISECRYIGDRFQLTLGELRRRGKIGLYVNTDKLIETIEKETQTGREMKKLPKHLWPVTMTEMWTRMEIGGEEREVVVTFAQVRERDNTFLKHLDTCVRIEYNKFPGGLRPYAMGRYIKRPNEMYGVGAIAPIKDTSKELDEWRTMTSMQQELALSPPFLAHDEAQMMGQQLFLYPGRVIGTPMGRGSLEPLPINQNTNVGAYMESLLRSDIRQTARAPDTYAGASQSGRQTAYEVGQNLQEAAVTQSLPIKRYKLEVLKPILRNWMALNAMHYDQDVSIRALGEGAFRKDYMVTVSPNEIQMQYDFEILDSAEVAMLGVRSQRFVSMANALPPEIWKVIKVPKLLEEWLKANGEENADRFIHKEPDPEDMLSAREHLMLIDKNHEPEVLPQMNHMMHLSVYKLFKDGPEYAKWTPQKKVRLEQHEQNHLDAVMRLMEQQTGFAQKMALGGRPPEEAAGQHGGRRKAGAQETPAGQLQTAAGQNYGGL